MSYKWLNGGRYTINTGDQSEEIFWLSDFNNVNGGTFYWTIDPIDAIVFDRESEVLAVANLIQLRHQEQKIYVVDFGTKV